ncbi:hypothetical protein XENTR_v10000266 [Xenopus tropicalis]|nr:hypothetical protein XENTR_v10000266 [Xenopus tropicalis]
MECFYRKTSLIAKGSWLVCRLLSQRQRGLCGIKHWKMVPPWLLDARTTSFIHTAPDRRTIGWTESALERSHWNKKTSAERKETAPVERVTEYTGIHIMESVCDKSGERTMFTLFIQVKIERRSETNISWRN